MSSLLVVLVHPAGPLPAALLCRMDGCALIAAVVQLIQVSSTKDFSAVDRTALFGE